MFEEINSRKHFQNLSTEIKFSNRGSETIESHATDGMKEQTLIHMRDRNLHYDRSA